MEIGKWRDRIKSATGKYKYALVVLIVGIVFMMIPSKETGTAEPLSSVDLTQQQTPELSDELSELLSKIEGAGNVRVLLSISQGERVIYQTDTTLSQTEDSSDSRTQTILITDSQRNETGLIHQKNPPVYQGAIVLAQGADSPTVKLSLVDAVAKITGLSTDKIAIMKMK